MLGIRTTTKQPSEKMGTDPSRNNGTRLVERRVIWVGGPQQQETKPLTSHFLLHMGEGLFCFVDVVCLLARFCFFETGSYY